MARLPRLTVADYPHHVIVRGNNRQAVFFDHADRNLWLKMTGDYAKEFGVAVHAYVLMDNHIHLLLTPSTAEALPKMMQALGRSYVRAFNKKYQRTGTLWEGRYKCALIQSERYLLACMAYIDLNPVRAGMCESAADYPWSSYAHYAGQRSEALITPHALYWTLGNTPFARENAYAELVQNGIAPDRLSAITDSALKGWALGDGEFIKQLAKSSPRRLTKAKAGRPVKPSALQT